MKLINGTILALTAAFALLPLACGKEARLSGLSQTCAFSGDCQEGLLCVNQACVQNSYPISPTAKECVLVECSTTDDCCGPDDLGAPADTCAEYKTACDADSTALACDYYDTYCVCNRVCDADNGQCVSKGCTTDAQCFGGTCDTATGKCHQCDVDDDCNGDQTCVDGACISGCKADEECELFETCTKETGLCKRTGCTTDRECILYRGRADAVCKKSGTTTGVPECDVPCKETAECGTNHVCDGGSCKYLGCETDPECVTYFKDMNLLPSTNDVSAKCVAIKK
jgi:hypothetical protein